MIKKIQRGVTLIEMMIAMLLGLIITGAIITIFISNVKSSSENIRMIHLNQELRTVVSFMADELKRAGYSGDPTNAVFTNSWNTATAGCVLYAYDVDGNGALDAGSENFGFRLDNQEVKWGNATSCGNITQAITDVDTARISTFTLTPESIMTSASAATQTLYLEVVIVGETDLNPDTVSRRIEETIRVRNEDAD